MVRILLADDHPIVREGLRALLETQPDFEVIAECANGAEVLRVTARLQPDMLLLDLEMPVMDGVETIRQLTQQLRSRPTNVPQRAQDAHNQQRPRIIVFTAFDDDDRIIHALQAGADGYLLKDQPREEIFKAIRITMQGGSILQPIIATKLLRHVGQVQRNDSLATQSTLPVGLPPVEELTERELEVLHLLAQGMPNKEIAAHLVISERTAKFHVSSIMGKLGATNRTEAVALAAQRGLVHL
jgi:Response regulator containing a CheY-like receiver domain and an HTH DNA-binding domain